MSSFVKFESKTTQNFGLLRANYEQNRKISEKKNRKSSSLTLTQNNTLQRKRKVYNGF